MIERAHATALLDRVVPPVLATAVCAFAAGSSVEVWVADIGRPLRWVALALFAVTAIAYAAAAERRARLPLTFFAGAAMLAALAQPAAAVQAPRNAERVLPLEDEQGRPGVGRRARPFRRRFLDVNGRLRPVLGAFGEGAQRPVAGYGFGMESRAFVDRYYGFYSAVAENSYAGLFLQLGAAGLGLFALTFGAVLVAAIGARRRLDERGRSLTTVAA